MPVRQIWPHRGVGGEAGMIVMHVSFEVERDPALLDAWIVPLVQRARKVPGCMLYEYLIDPEDPRKRRIIEVFESAEALAAHLGAPVHVEMLAEGSRVYGMRDLQIHQWKAAEGYRFTTRERTDQHVDGREHVDALIAGYWERKRVPSVSPRPLVN
jgi:quinol monooxygenase YgiN